MVTKRLPCDLNAALINGRPQEARDNMPPSDETGQKRGHNPLIGLDIERLEAEMESYQQWLDEHADEAYIVAEQARSLGYDHKEYVEIP
jgi:hypothetical protein